VADKRPVRTTPDEVERFIDACRRLWADALVLPPPPTDWTRVIREAGQRHEARLRGDREVGR
jgi:hypothetical protein